VQRKAVLDYPNGGRGAAAGLKVLARRTLLPAAVLDPSGQASPAEQQPC
jgi:hypothetical protein